ncbi:MAG: hypothetical protein K0R38_5769 [Polyangiaceae bacterium]|nr:hypothetical protein [Polyangiaceae bacterium]
MLGGTKAFSSPGSNAIVAARVNSLPGARRRVAVPRGTAGGVPARAEAIFRRIERLAAITLRARRDVFHRRVGHGARRERGCGLHDDGFATCVDTRATIEHARSRGAAARPRAELVHAAYASRTAHHRRARGAAVDLGRTHSVTGAAGATTARRRTACCASGPATGGCRARGAASSSSGSSRSSSGTSRSGRARSSTSSGGHARGRRRAGACGRSRAGARGRSRAGTSGSGRRRVIAAAAGANEPSVTKDVSSANAAKDVRFMSVS